MKYTIELTDAEQKAMEYITTDVNSWIQNAIRERARLAMEELVNDDINAKLANGEPVSGNKEEMILASTLPNAQERHDEMVKKMNNMVLPGTEPPK